MHTKARSRSKALRDAPALHPLHESTAGYSAMYAVMHDILQIEHMHAFDSALTFEESLYFLNFLADYDKGIAYHRKIMELDSVAGESLLLWIEAAKSSPQGGGLRADM